MKPKPKVILFSTPSCSWCNVAKDYLRKNKVDFKNIDVSKDQQAAMDMVRRTGQMGVPVVMINNKPVVGFNKSKIDQLLDLK